MNNQIIQIKGLKKIYQVGDVQVPALRGVDLTVTRGEFLSVVGPSGSGKSTLFHIVGGLTSPTSGAVFIDGADMTKMTDTERTRLRRGKVGFIFQKYNLLPTLTAMDNILMARYFSDSAGQPLSEQFHDLLKLLGIQHRLHHKPRALSGGNSSESPSPAPWSTGPPLLADEPPATSIRELRPRPLRAQGSERETRPDLLMITHNPEAAAYGHRKVTMRDGRLKEE